MKDSRFNKAIQEIRGISMSAVEKQAMRARILDAAGNSAESSSLHDRPVRSIWSVYSFGAWVGSHRMAVSVVTLILVIIGSDALVSASDRSLPGDALYAMKVSVAEPLRLAVTTGPAAKADVQAELLQKRFEEVETLAVQGKLDQTLEKASSLRVQSQVVRLDDNIKKVEKVSTEKADDVGSTVEASIRAHSRVLTEIRARKGVNIPRARNGKGAPPQDTSFAITKNKFSRQSSKTAVDIPSPEAVSISATSTPKTILASSTESRKRGFELKTRQKEMELFRKAQERLKRSEKKEEIRKHK